MTHAVLVPGSVIGCLNDAGLSHRPLWLANSTDVALGGHKSNEWIVVWAETIAVVRVESDPAGVPSATLLRSVAWSEVQAIRTQAGVGGGTLQLRMEEDWLDMLRF